MANLTQIAEINVDSRDRISGPVENAIFQFPESFTITQIRLLEIELPISFYNIRNINTNFLVIDFDEGAGELSATIADAPTTAGYTLAEFLTAIETAMNGVGSNTYHVTHNTTTNKITIYNDEVNNFKLLWNTGTNKDSYIAGYLGFSRTIDLKRNYTYTGTTELNLNVTNLIDISTNGTTTTSTIKLPVGSYTFTEFVGGVKTALDAETGFTTDATINKITNKLTITSTSALQFRFADGPNRFISTFNRIIGYSESNTPFSTEFASDTGTIDLAGDNYIFLRSPSITGVDQGVVTTNSSNDNQIIAKIQISEPTDGIMFYTNPTSFSSDLGNINNDGNQFRFSLAFYNSQNVNLNGHDYSCKLRVIYK